MDCIELENCKKWLEENLDKERYEHSLGTAECAKELAKKFGLDVDKAYFTGLIHDCAKCLPKDTLKNRVCNCEGLCDGELINPKTYHAPVGVQVAEEEFKITDKEILSAIRWHTLGKINMTDFEKIIYLADKIEARTRPATWAEPIRKALECEGLDKALLISYGNTIKSLVERNLKICKTTIDIYNDLLEITSKKVK